MDWGARLKDSAAAVDRTMVQVLFDNVDTGRVSQLQELPVINHSAPSDSTEPWRSIWGNAPRDDDSSSLSLSRTLSGTPSSAVEVSDNDISGRLTPYDHRPIRRLSESVVPDERGDDDFWKERQRIMRPNSPSRHYRPTYRTGPSETSKKKRNRRELRLTAAAV